MLVKDGDSKPGTLTDNSVNQETLTDNSLPCFKRLPF